MMKFSKAVYKRDALVCFLLAALLAAVFVLSALSANKSGSGYVRIIHGENEAEVLSLLRDSGDYTVGGVHIRIKDGRAFIYDSDCPDKVCTRMYGVDKNGGGAVCLPNRVVLESTDGNDTDYVIG